jgi:hypothetical protein
MIHPVFEQEIERAVGFCLRDFSERCCAENHARAQVTGATKELFLEHGGASLALSDARFTRRARTQRFCSARPV